jgi:predicted nucleic acid-binding protein
VILYWDSSAFVLLYSDVTAQGFDAVAAFRAADMNLVSKLTLLETHRALAALLTHGQLKPADFRRASQRLREDHHRLSARSIDAMLQGPALEKFCSLLLRHGDLGTADVLHVTTALLWKAELKRMIVFVTCDRRLARAARAEKLEVRAPPDAIGAP